MLVQTRQDFDKFMHDYRERSVLVVDTETNGLHPFQGDRLIGISVYFPEANTTYYLPFRHGVGKIDVCDDADELRWSTNARKAANMKWFWERFTHDYDNLPLEWLDEIKATWAEKHLIMYNALFDMAVFHVDGFPEPASFEDVMIGVSLVDQWGDIKIKAPFTWTVTDQKKAKCAAAQVGKWARGEDGELLLKEQYGNKRLKWISAMLGIDRATFGEEELALEAEALSARICAEVPETKEHPHKYVKVDEKSQMWMLPPQSVFTYAINDVILTYEVCKWVYEVLGGWENMSLYHDLQATLAVAWRMERDGVLLDRAAAEKQIELLEPRITALREAIGVNPNSPKELLPYLQANLGNDFSERMPEFMTREDRLNLKVYPEAEITSTEADELARVGDHALVRMVLLHRKLSKTVNTYLYRWLQSADDNGRVHPHFETTGAVTGRWSSSGDFGNAQNIPDRGGYTIKTAIIPDPDKIMVAWDYGQLELRLATWIAEVKDGWGNYEMTDLFNSGKDMHAHVRDAIGVRDIVFPNMSDAEIVVRLGYDISEPNHPAIVAKECRQIAKTLNFGLLYSGTGAMVSKLLKIEREPADVLYNEWNLLFPAFRRVNSYYERQALTPRVRPDGRRVAMYVTQPISGKHRKFDKLPTWATYKDDEGKVRSFNPQQAEARKAFNFIVQGLGGYICTMSATKVPDVMLNFQIHDALDGQLEMSRLDKARDVIYAMTNWPEITPNLVVDMQAGHNWQDMRKVNDVDLWISTQGTQGYA